MSNKLKVVIRHEYVTIVKQPSFWITLIAIPVLIGLGGLFGYVSKQSDKNDISSTDAKSLQVKVIDNSNLIDRDLLRESKVQLAPDSTQSTLVDDVKSGKLDGLIVYPADLEQSGKIQVFADDSGSGNSDTVSSLSTGLLQRSLLKPIESEKLQALALGQSQTDVVSYQDGKVSRDISEMIIPGLFLVLFYIVLVFSVSYALTSVSDEKENRSIEMVLSYVKPQTLILGKLIAIVLITFTQISYFIVLGLAAFGIFKALGNSISLPFNLSDLAIDTSGLVFGIGFLLLGFIFFVGLMATIGALFPSTKDASAFSTIFFILPAAPFWLMDTITKQADNVITQVMTYLPLTSPTTALIRNTFGNLSTSEGVISLAILAASTVVVVMLAGKAFKVGTLEFTSRVSLKALLGRK